MKRSLHVLLTFCAFFAGLVVFSSSAQAATSTICASGCDYLTLEEAINGDVPGQDTFVFANGYAADESPLLFVPDDTTLMCEPGVIFGSVPDDIHPELLYIGDNTLIQDCTFQDTNIYHTYYGGDPNHISNITIINNTFLDQVNQHLVFVNINEFTVSNNHGIHNVTMNSGKNGTISDNNMECRHISPCLSFYNAPDNIVIENNVITEYRNSSPRVDFAGVTNSVFTGNTLQVTAGAGGTMMDLISVDNMTITDNLFLHTETGGLGIYLYNLDTETAVTIEHNSFIDTGVNPGSCLLVNPQGGGTLREIDIQFNYNLCHQETSGNSNVIISHDPLFYDINFSAEYNGFSNPLAITDSNNVYTTSTLSSTNLIAKPVFRIENADPSDDYRQAPMSRLLSDGSYYMGVFDDGARINTYTIDDDCIVDYVSCHSQLSSILNDVLVSGDTAQIAAGTYSGVSITGPLSGFTVQGSGAATIFDGSLNNQSSLALTNVTSSAFSDIRLVNSTETPPVIQSGYVMSLAVLTFGGNDYDDAGGVLFIEDPGPTLVSITADGDPVIVDGVTNINGFLFDLGGTYFTILAPENIADSMLEIQTLLGVPPTHFIEDLYIANGGGNYTFNSTNIDNQGITVMTGSTLPPTLIYNFSITYSYSAAGLKLDNASDNTFENILIESNDVGALFINGATGNIIEDSVFNTNAVSDITSYSFGGINDLLNSTFLRTSSVIEAGMVRAIFDSSIRIVDPLMAPLPGVGVNFTSMNGLINTNATTDGSGLTPVIETIAYIMSPTSTALTSGGYNPFTITANANGPYSSTSTPATLSEITVFEVMMSIPPVVTPPVTTGGGGGLPTIDPRTGTYPPIEPVEPVAATKPTLIKETKVHMLVKLLDDGDSKTQEDSTVYYLGADGKRHLFPNQSVFNSWYCDFSKVVSVEPRTLAKYPIGKNVTYRPGLNMVKFPTNPNVYVVQPGRALRHIKDEAAAISMFSSNWAKLVYDLSDTTYSDYVFSDELPVITDLSVLNQSPSYPSGEMDIEGYLDIVTGGQVCR